MDNQENINSSDDENQLKELRETVSKHLLRNADFFDHLKESINSRIPEKKAAEKWLVIATMLHSIQGDDVLLAAVHAMNFPLTVCTEDCGKNQATFTVGFMQDGYTLQTKGMVYEIAGQDGMDPPTTIGQTDAMIAITLWFMKTMGNRIIRDRNRLFAEALESLLDKKMFVLENDDKQPAKELIFAIHTALEVEMENVMNKVIQKSMETLANSEQPDNPTSQTKH